MAESGERQSELRDHRGEPIALLGRTLPLPPGASNDDVEAAWREIDWSGDKRVYFWRLVLVCVIAVVICGSIGWAAAAWLRGWRYVAVLAIGPIVTLIAGKLILPTTRSASQGLYLAIGRCAQCAYRLTDLKPELDGCVVCPECGAAWKAGGIGKPAGGAG